MVTVQLQRQRLTDGVYHNMVPVPRHRRGDFRRIDDGHRGLWVTVGDRIVKLWLCVRGPQTAGEMNTALCSIYCRYTYVEIEPEMERDSLIACI